MLRDFIALIYPNVCLACGNSLYRHEKHICTFCSYQLPMTNFHYHQDNPVSKIFWGRVNIHSATAFYYFKRGTKVQHLLHELKYKGQKGVGETLGEWFGKELKKSPLFDTVDIVVPVPLHPKKKKKRGYNQSDCIAEGLAKGMEITWSDKLLFRDVATETQTKKSRIRRWENVSSIFRVDNDPRFHNKHFLLVDDVITTGSTIESCAQELIKIPGAKVSVGAIAFTQF
jgi:ComF family protein